MGRSVRTVQTWEKDEGLPVHRHQHGKGATVYAYGTELDAWLAGRSRTAPTARATQLAIWIATSVLTLLIVGLGWWKLGGPGAEPASSAASGSVAPMWLMIASFENETGEAVLDETIEAAFAGAIANAPNLHVAPRERVVDTLRLMGLPPETVLDRSLVREIALRDGGVGATITGKVRRLDGGYLVSVEVSDVETGVARATLSALVGTQAELLGAVESLSSRVLAAVVTGSVAGDQPSTTPSLRRVSTFSLDALQLYTRADALMRSGPSISAASLGATERLLSEAIAIDPGFASAHLLLGWALYNQGKPAEEYMPPVDRALELAETVPSREALFIRGSHAHLSGNPEEAAAHYRALVALHPDHYWAAGNLASQLRRLGLRDESLEIREAIARSRPNSFMENWTFALHKTEREGLEAAVPAIRHALAIAPPPEARDADHAWGCAWLEGALLWEPWLEGDVADMVAEVERLERRISGLPAGESRQYAIWLIRRIESTLGRLDRVDQWTELDRADGQRAYDRLTNAFLRNDAESFDQALDSYLEYQPANRPINPLPLELLTRVGRLEDAERLLPRAREDGADLLRGHLALAAGDVGEAIVLLERGLEALFGSNSRYFVGVEALAEAYRFQGDAARARVVMEEASSRRSRTIASFSGAFWLRHQMLLADLYRELDLVDRATALEAELAELLVQADDDHPLRIALESRRHDP